MILCVASKHPDVYAQQQQQHTKNCIKYNMKSLKCELMAKVILFQLINRYFIPSKFRMNDYGQKVLEQKKIIIIKKYRKRNFSRRENCENVFFWLSKFKN